MLDQDQILAGLSRVPNREFLALPILKRCIVTQRLSDNEFLNIVEATPLISLDLVVRDAKQNVLLGYRENRPAQNFWFVPGGRVRKNERLDMAFGRLCQLELNLSFARSKAQFLGAYEHFYLDNFAGAEGSGTHYVVMAYEIQLASGQTCSLDDQHSKQRWWTEEALLASGEVHGNTKAYFDPQYRNFPAT